MLMANTARNLFNGVVARYLITVRLLNSPLTSKSGLTGEYYINKLKTRVTNTASPSRYM